MTINKYEIDMLNVGNADAILIHLYDEKDNDYIVLVDAGNNGDGNKVLQHMKKYYGKTTIDLAICTHPDSDHIGGFEYLLDKVEIKEFWIHNPTNHINIENIDKKIQKSTIYESLTPFVKSLKQNKTIIDKIKINSIKIIEPFNGLEHNKFPIKVLGPDEEYYEAKLGKFRDYTKLTEQKELSKSLENSIDKSHENNSSAVFLMELDSKKFLFTGDAGPEALDRVINQYNDDTNSIYWIKVPHHGSINNLNSDLIKHFSPQIAYISCKHDDNYPSQEVVNELKESGTKVYATCKSGKIWHHCKTHERDSYTTANHL